MHETRMYFNAVVLKYQNYLSTLPPLYAATPPGQRQRPRTIVAFDLCQQHVHIALVRLVTGLKNGFAFIKEEHLNSKRTNRFVTRTEEYFLMGGSTCCHPQTTRGYPVCLETILEILGPLQLDAIGHHSSFWHIPTRCSRECSNNQPTTQFTVNLKHPGHHVFFWGKLEHHLHESCSSIKLIFAQIAHWLQAGPIAAKHLRGWFLVCSD